MAKKFGANKILVPKEFWSIKNFNVKNGTNIARTNVSWTDVTCHGHTCNLLKSMTTGWEETNFLGTRPRPKTQTYKNSLLDQDQEKVDYNFLYETRPK